MSEGVRQERQRVINLLEGIKAKSSWDFETQILQLIEELKKETK